MDEIYDPENDPDDEERKEREDISKHYIEGDQAVYEKKAMCGRCLQAKKDTAWMNRGAKGHRDKVVAFKKARAKVKAQQMKGLIEAATRGIWEGVNA
jgi:hypothetical protein